MIHEKPQEDITRYTDEPDEFLSLDINQFVSAFHLFLQKKKKVEEIKERYERIERQKRNAETKTNFILSLFQEDKKDEYPLTGWWKIRRISTTSPCPSPPCWRW